MQSITFSQDGLDTILILIEIVILKGLPNFQILGLCGKSIQESKDRILANLDRYNKRPMGKIIVNMSPSSIKKHGAHYDLPIFLCLYFRDNYDLSPYIIIGEISLMGRIKSVSHCILAATLAYKTNKILICSKEDLTVVTLVLPLKQVRVFEHLDEIILFLNSGKYDIPNLPLVSNTSSIKQTKVISYFSKFEILFMLLAVSGGHHTMTVGAPGCGKTTINMLMSYITPNVTKDISVDILKIYGCANVPRENIYEPPFRSPHSSSSLISLTGGGSKLRPGEMSLAHGGTLFLDEVCEFNKEFLNSMRTPLEEKKIHISRASKCVSYDCGFRLAIASNPCSCGLMFEQKCTCKISKYYLKRIPGPILDRIEMNLYVYMKQIDTNLRKYINIAKFKVRIVNIQARAYDRYQSLNSNVMDIEILIRKGLFDNLSLVKAQHIINIRKYSMRKYHSLLKVARTIADIQKYTNVTAAHIQQASFFI